MDFEIPKEQIIFYGAGRNAKANLQNWEAMGLKPVCFADADESKHYTLFPGTEYEILPLSEAISKYQDFVVYLTLVPEFILNVRSSLIESGVPEERIRTCENVEYRLGCYYLVASNLRINVCSQPAISFSVCCFPNSKGIMKHIRYEDKHKLREEFIKFEADIQTLINKHMNSQPSACDGCINFVRDFHYNERRVKNLTLLGGFRGERCNVKCCYCSAATAQSACLLDDNWSYMDVLNELAEYLTTGIRLSPQSCEITASPYRHEIYDTINFDVIR